MKVAFFMLLLGSAGPYAESYPFPSMEKCFEFKAAAERAIIEHNSQPKRARVEQYALSCVPLKDSPKGSNS